MKVYNYQSPMMGIYSRPGTKVVFMGINGYSSELLEALNKLEVGKVYTVEDTEVHSSSSTVWLKEVKGKFNTVHFTPYVEETQMNTVHIQEACDSVTIYVNENVKCHITQDDRPGMKLKELFKGKKTHHHT